MLRLFVDLPLAAGLALELPDNAARHVQVRRQQPGDTVTLFNGLGGEWTATVLAIGRRRVDVELQAHHAVDREAPAAVTLAVGMPANERMDWLVEKAAEMGAAQIVPLVCERSVLRLDGDRAAKRREHWHSVAVAAAEQSGATRVTGIAEVSSFKDWLGRLAAGGHERRQVLSLRADAPQLRVDPHEGRDGVSSDLPGPVACVLSGPEGGLTPAEEDQARLAGFVPFSLGARTLRAETAPLVALSRWLAER